MGGRRVEAHQDGDGELRALLGEATVGRPRARSRLSRRRASPAGPCSRGPIAFTVGPGRHGAASTGRRPDSSTTAAESAIAGARPRPIDDALTLDLGAVRGTAEVLIDGESAGVRVCSPYRFDLSGLGRAGDARGARAQHARPAPRWR